MSRLLADRIAHRAAILVLSTGISLLFADSTAAQITWSGGSGGSGSAWLTNTNWTGNVVPGSAGTTTNSDIAQFGSAGTVSAIGINGNGLSPLGNYYLGTVTLASDSTINRAIGNSSTTAGADFALQLNGTGANNLILDNQSLTRTLTLQASAQGGNRTMTVRLVNAASTINTVGGDIIISTQVTGTGGIVKTGAGTLTLSAAAGNTYSGKTVVNGGFIAVSNENRFGANPGSFTADQITLNGGGIRSTAITSFVNNRGITLGASGGTFDTSGGQIQLTSVVTGTGALVKAGANTLLFSGTHTYQGSTTVQNGTLQVDGNGNLPTSTVVTLGDASANTSGILRLGAGNVARDQQIAGLQNAGTGTANAVVGGGSTSISTLTVNTASNTSYTYGGLIGSGTAVAHQDLVALVKSGSGSVTLTGNNGYSGGTTISAGTLFANNATNSTGTGNVDVNGGRLAGSGTVGGSSIGVNVNPGGTIAPGATASSVGTLTVNGTLGINNGATYEWSISNTGTGFANSGSAAFGASGGIKDLLSVGESLLLANGFTMAIDPTAGLNEGLYYSWQIAQAGTAISLPSSFQVNLLNNPGGWSSTSSAYTLSTQQLGLNSFALYLNIQGVPEPSELALCGLTIIAAAAFLIRQHRRTPSTPGA